MRTIELQGMAVEIFDGIDELPVTRFHKFNKMLLIDSGVGSDLADVDNHIERAIRFCKAKQPDMAMVELENMRQGMYLIQSEVSPKHLAFCVLVKSIDGEPCTDLSDDGLKALLQRFADAPHTQLTAQTEAVKKKIDEELNLYFPGNFDDATVKEYYDQLKIRTLIMLDAIIAGDVDERQAEIDKMTTLLITYTRPMSFDGTGSMEIQYDRQFENMCLMLSQHLHANAKTYTVLEYYNAFDYVKKMLKPQKSNKGQNNR